MLKQKTPQKTKYNLQMCWDNSDVYWQLHKRCRVTNKLTQMREYKNLILMITANGCGERVQLRTADLSLSLHDEYR